MKRRIALVVPDDASPDRLDHYLGVHATDLSRTRAKEIIASGLVTLNGERVKPSHIVLPGDRIEADIPELAHLSADPENIPLDICYEDEHLLVVNKCAGMVVHPAPGSYSGTLVNALVGRGGELSSLGGSLRPGIVHRLDRGTSGLIVVAKTDEVHRRLSAMFEAREVEKTYLALVWGVFNRTAGTIEAPIGRRRSDRKLMGVVPDGRTATTGWRVREQFPYAAFMEIDLKTGRTHQIRVHMSHIHRPVMGDADYGGARSSFGDVPPHYRRQAERVNGRATHQALFARRLAFTHPATGAPVAVATPMPDDFADLLALLRHPEGETGRVIGIDPGEARIGVSLSDEGRYLASSLETLSGLDDSSAATRISEIADEHGADTIVVGYPIRMDGTVGHRALRSRELAVELEDASSCRVVLHDERLTSALAERVMKEKGERKRGRKGRVDQIAASAILQGYLDAQAIQR